MRLLLALVIVVSACSDGDRGGGAGVGATATTAAGSTPPPPPPPSPSPAFYVPPDPLPPGQPGEVIRSEPLAAPAGARGWRVLYHSRSIDGRDIAVSGMVAAPVEAGEGRPVVAWAHGTTGSADVCAPSRQGDLTDVPHLADLLDRGYVVAATDYEGLGTPGPHPYLVGESEGRGVLDSARAARLLPTGAGPSTLVFGHSQGGHAALFAGQVAPAYAPELEVRGVVASAPAAELAQLLGGAASFPQGTGFVVAAGAAYAAVYPEARLDEVFTPEAIADLQVVEEQCVVGVLLTYARPLGTVIRRAPGEVEPWAGLVARNTPGNERLGPPLLVVQGDLDELVPTSTTQAFAARACASGTTVDLRRYRTADHGAVVDASREDVLKWMDDRLAGRRARSTCRG